MSDTCLLITYQAILARAFSQEDFHLVPAVAARVLQAYLSAIIVYLYSHDFKQAEKCFNDCSQIDVFLGSDQGRCAFKLISAYREGDADEIKRVAQSSIISHLDQILIVKLARKLPTGDVSAFKSQALEEQEEPLDEDGLT
ncbi:hypothetical protein QQ045_021560 [Rhodiola kirilowii]